ncbi:hypothetical protein FALBO_11478 [Fusarium albosuccineum]|uniref:2EXR domain-containing protein n=1 Tax=Fusarium albosuccineum TaxID=1237068 RepID=A0A8H4L5R8_9HYPO|nr:hypothetical protein FALBO_11478 [Fusarium albosuccineum]
MPFRSLPAEIRIQIWKLCLRDEPRFLILDLFPEVASSHQPGPNGPVKELIVIGGCFASTPDQHLPVRPIISQITMKSLGTLCSESRAVTLACYPDLIRVKKSRFQERSGRDTAQLLLRCNLQTDIVRVNHNETGWWYFDNFRQFVINTYDMLRVSDSAERAEEFKSALNKINHLVMPHPEVKWGSPLPHEDRRANLLQSVKKIFPLMRSLKTVTLCDARYPERTEPIDRIYDLFYDEPTLRFVSPACYTMSMAVLQKLVEPLTQGRTHESDSTEISESRLRELGYVERSRTTRIRPVQGAPRKDGQLDDAAIALPKVFEVEEYWLK